ncbi:MAG: HTH domain-containing protein [Nanoarchaeota archaeon]
MKEIAPSKDKVIEQLRESYAALREQHNLTYEEILNQLQSVETTLPCTIFSSSLSSLETITKYLKENQHFTLKEIAQKLNRTYRTIWGAYHASLHKHPSGLTAIPTPYHIPLSLFSERKLSILETITHHLRSTHHLRYSQIAKILHRDPRTVWTTEYNAKGKLK